MIWKIKAHVLGTISLMFAWVATSMLDPINVNAQFRNPGITSDNPGIGPLQTPVSMNSSPLLGFLAQNAILLSTTSALLGISGLVLAVRHKHDGIKYMLLALSILFIVLAVAGFYSFFG